MLRLIRELPEQCETALGIGRNFKAEPLETKPNVVYLTGVGDSAIAADMVVSTVGEDMEVPVISDSGTRLPVFVGEDSLVFVLDYSGKSQSALRNYREARARNAKVICVTSGGRLHEVCTKDGCPIARIPPGQPARTAIGYLYAPVVAIIELLGLASGAIEKLSFAIRLLKNVRESFRFANPTARNLAKQTALALADKIPVIYGAPGYREAVMQRWKSQMGASSKLPACGGLFPNAADGEIAAWESDRQYPPVGFVFLTDALDKTTELRATMGAAQDLLQRFGATEIEMRGGTTYERLLYGVYLGDYVSYYLAMLNGVDPMPSEYVSQIAARFEELPPQPTSEPEEAAPES